MNKNEKTLVRVQRKVSSGKSVTKYGRKSLTLNAMPSHRKLNAWRPGQKMKQTKHNKNRRKKSQGLISALIHTNKCIKVKRYVENEEF